ncbi:MAG: alkaline shock response membrane anchor protein AmaP [Oscillospiraceae bacterium]|nr:alkaline shock response membrane anchor protein AmaP [Oscillospiraceae bacterium]
MKILDRLGLIIFSTIVLLISLTLCTVIFEWIELEDVTEVIEMALQGNASTNILLGTLIVLMLLAIKCIFFNSISRAEVKNKSGITLENDYGKLVVSRDAIENLIGLVVKGFESVENISAKVDVDKESNVRIMITLFTHPEAIIKDLTSKLQKDIKETMKKSLNVDVKDITIRVKDIAVKKEPVVKEKEKEKDLN